MASRGVSLMSSILQGVFFSSRRRHTILQGDWSSDVCSSDLERARRLELVAEIDGAVVAMGNAGFDTWTSTGGAGWAFVTVEPGLRRQGIGDAIGEIGERRGGEECRSRGAADPLKKKKGEIWG